ncbi:dipeptidyl aminopeptidase/acylaminoacyl peptidase [Paucibacter oligotrophus]|uniref:Dipeptidyl aminopeptidase/acylaminoacyl peptidase n=1 Tax=Roseateles oligotrophus TaxID=1769250 RepID=A0A840L3R2_9BURK|nr:prolyl oligopeptidase family serine peptidase [Roseateles oligotrophus]MBB4843154.1 dipeptidyl aminopeptidase/acylaminoacyl peptidase [Roseateles oligotrophus]
MKKYQKSLRIWLAAVSLLGAALGPALAQERRLEPGASLVADGMPPLFQPSRPAAKEAASPRFVDWHLLRREMLVLAQVGGRQQLHLLKAAGAKPLVLTEGRDAVAQASWEPERGEYLVFSRDQGGDEAYQLYRLSPAGEGEPLAQPLSLSGSEGRVSDYQFLPKGRGLVYLWERLNRQSEAGAKAAKPLSRLMWVDPDQNPARPRELAAVEGGRFTELAVSPGGSIVIKRTVQGRSQLLRYELDGKPGRPLGAVEARAEDDAEEAPKLASAPAADALWRRQALKSDYRHLVRLDLDSGQRQPWLTQMHSDLEALAVPPRADGRPLALLNNEQGISVLRLFDPLQAQAQPHRIAGQLPAGVMRNLRWHGSLPLLGFEHASAQSPGRIYAYNSQTDELQLWAGHEGAAGGVEYASLQWTSFDGQAISGLHIAPPARFSGPRPVYISIHGGPSAQSRPGYLSGLLRQLVEELGMHVILPNVRGSDGFGQRFLNLDNGLRREDSVKDISALLDLIATRSDMDAGRVVVAGGSYGGYMSLAVATHESKRIAGSICRVGIANFVSFLENTESYRRDNRRAEYGDERDPAMRAFLQRISPLARAGEVRKPLFVVHGRNDPRVPYGEAQQMVAAVRAVGTPVWFLSAEDEGHSFTKASNREYLNQATLEFVRRVLGNNSLQTGNF